MNVFASARLPRHALPETETVMRVKASLLLSRMSHRVSSMAELFSLIEAVSED